MLLGVERFARRAVSPGATKFVRKKRTQEREGSWPSSPQVESKEHGWGVRVIPLPEPQCYKFRHACSEQLTGYRSHAQNHASFIDTQVSSACESNDRRSGTLLSS